ncbi:zinc-dependent alcohol dehydrogenase family protein [Aspergillus mulundensis]|uniref:Putative zinc-type alcohol dehydrogenase-like protein n=1 Tax=Aspergillus mulundensis TaxID=1810919 RepID=A0A3D8RZC3_9EURO|nr:putative zinc-type alcohol dehydrogenase-like protein [Aspergillus mulundensis]RDW79210.1 putative zinc-type alcohol dehydrogenase-like protein [Aspergillus mulundensis]
MSTPTTQTVYRLIGERTSIHNIQPSSEPIPTASKHELLIRIRAVALNYRDIAISSGLYPFYIKDNVIPCSDASGDVVSVGEGARGFEIGDRVVISFDVANLYGPQRDWTTGHGGPIDGMLRQYIAVPAAAVVKVPGGSEAPQSYSELASLVCAGLTAWNGLFGVQPLKPGQVALFQGTGGVSINGLLLAKAAGAKTIITSSSDEKLAYVQKKFGADHVINYKTTPDWASKALELTNGRGVDFVLENGGAGTIAQSIKSIAFGGVVSVIGFLAQAKQEEMPDVAALAISRGCIVRGVTIGPVQMLEDLVRFVGNKGLRLPVEKEFGFSRDDVVGAFEYLKSAQHVGKVCIKVD